MKALVTGHKGFVGRHMTAELNTRGYDVTGCDAVDGEDARDLFATNTERYDLVVHCAAVVGGRLMIDGSPLTLAVEDLSLDALMFRWAMRTRPHRVVYFSSSAAYPISMQGPGWTSLLAEDDINLNKPALPDQTYGWVKLTGERLAAEANAAGIRTHVFRPFSGYGSDQALDYPFPSFINRAANLTLDTFQVWGDGHQVRDFVHISDVVGAVMAAVDQEYLEPLNIGTGVGVSFNRLAEMCMQVSSSVRPIEHLPAMPVGVHHRVADITRLADVYAPKVSLLQGVCDAVTEYRKR
jgi:nucleoside-diphosphate-sugar epimerase